MGGPDVSRDGTRLPTPERGDATTKAALPRFAPDSRRALILEAARVEFVERGWAAGRTRTIALSAGVSEGLVFRYFESKDRLFEAAILEPLTATVHEMVSAAARFDVVDDIGRRKQSELFQVRFLEAMREVAPLVGLALFSDRQRGARFFTEHISPLFVAMTEALERAMGTRSFVRVDPEVVAIVLSGAYFGYGIATNFGVELPLPPDFAKVMTDLIFHGLVRD
jgi:AcrR family transcriptional regulator